MNQEHINLYFQYLTQSTTLLQTDLDIHYAKALSLSIHQLHEFQPFDELTLDVKLKMDELLMTMEGIPFQKEEIRKAMQLALLQAMKDDMLEVQELTPDTIGILIHFFIERLIPSQKIQLLDPLAGSGNLLATIQNISSKEMVLLGVEHQASMVQIMQSMADALELDIQCFFQDTLHFKGYFVDAMVMDFSLETEPSMPYFPYEVLTHHAQNVQPGGYVFAVIFDDFFDQAGSSIFRELIQDRYDVIGLVKLPKTLFKRYAKSLLILRKKATHLKGISKVLAIELPDIREQEMFRQAISNINQWIDEFIIKGEN